VAGDRDLVAERLQLRRELEHQADAAAPAGAAADVVVDEGYPHSSS
jgi:hypothetical protein